MTPHTPTPSAAGSEPQCPQPESEYERYLRQQLQQFEDDITDGRCYPEMPEGQFIRSK